MRSEQGFTLVEVLVALLIFSTAILGLMRAGTQNIRAVQIAEQKQIAGIIADNQLLLAVHNDDEQGVGTQQRSVRMANRDWHWNIRTEKTPQEGLLKLTVTIRVGDSEQIILSRIAYSQVKG